MRNGGLLMGYFKPRRGDSYFASKLHATGLLRGDSRVTSRLKISPAPLLPSFRQLANEQYFFTYSIRYSAKKKQAIDNLLPVFFWRYL